ncbi:phosphoenolpyruvate--protein phosphotransferase [Opitutus terrae]|uniref:Phosphoenolpyruvate-protein phosphotransferase n=1 Tax=Opitutus terrae (strain DSM 11246 / JCM 15787 / PB90-1) TaxID=452637 RepID=B1ZXA3_OPITP|nr:phosphoenolpyruvate--protein phosphotransferase [Opitutus terrae]ACB76155.1 phosphoenolpyruvate-protein phosphotransferase [Opitutus terrae PB90-1]
MTAADSEPAEMILGLAAATGIARGQAVICHCGDNVAVPRRLLGEDEVPGELQRFETALRETEGHLRTMETEVRARCGAADAAVFDAQIQMLRDPLLRHEVIGRCTKGKLNVEAALSDAVDELMAAFRAIDDPVFRERAADVQDVGRRLLNRLLAREDTDVRSLPAGSVVVARELLPSLAAGLGPNRIRALVAERGGTTAHAVILARSLGIPTVIHADGATTKIRPHDPVIVDGVAGRVFVRPSESVSREYERLQASLANRDQALRELVTLPTVTQDGVAIGLSANVGNVADAAAAARAHADGVGLYRTEFAFLVNAGFPTEEEQFQIYRSAAAQLKGREMVLRVLDLGSDKLLPYFPLPIEANPSLGRRGTRLLMRHPEILRTQLRAALRVSATHALSLLFPMIGGLDEFLAARQAVEDAKAALRATGQPFDPAIRVGAMIETPAAAITARALVWAADFLSVGTNDLVQYLLTTDRTSSEMAGYYEPLHPAVLQVLKHIIEAATAEAKPVSLCGEIAGNPAYTELLLGLGVRSLSVAPTELLEIRRVVRTLDSREASRLAERALAAGTIAEVKTIVAAKRVPNDEATFQRRALQRWRWEGGAGP